MPASQTQWLLLFVLAHKVQQQFISVVVVCWDNNLCWRLETMFCSIISFTERDRGICISSAFCWRAASSFSDHWNGWSRYLTTFQGSDSLSLDHFILSSWKLHRASSPTSYTTVPILCVRCITVKIQGEGLEIGKNALCKTKGFLKHESSLCHKYAVAMLTQPCHVDEYLKERL